MPERSGRKDIYPIPTVVEVWKILDIPPGDRRIDNHNSLNIRK
jgi:hypothetical protein